MDEFLKKAQVVLDWIMANMAWVIGSVVLLVVLLVLWKVLRRRKRRPPPPAPDLTIDVTSLCQGSLPIGSPTLEFYHLPVRLAAIVLAPVGRVRRLPPSEQLTEVIDMIVPGLGEVAVAHRPLVRLWPGQVSVRGFANTFFSHAKLPGDRGKGTRWSSVAGMFKIEGQPLMAALVLRTDSPNSLGQVVIDAEQKWLGCLRVKGAY